MESSNSSRAINLENNLKNELTSLINLKKQKSIEEIVFIANEFYKRILTAEFKPNLENLKKQYSKCTDKKEVNAVIDNFLDIRRDKSTNNSPESIELEKNINIIHIKCLRAGFSYPYEEELLKVTNNYIFNMFGMMVDKNGKLRMRKA